MDIGVVLYEITPEGKYFELSYFIGIANYFICVKLSNALNLLSTQRWKLTKLMV